MPGLHWFSRISYCEMEMMPLDASPPASCSPRLPTHPPLAEPGWHAQLRHKTGSFYYGQFKQKSQSAFIRLAAAGVSSSNKLTGFSWSVLANAPRFHLKLTKQTWAVFHQRREQEGWEGMEMASFSPHVFFILEGMQLSHGVTPHVLFPRCKY